MSVTRTAARGLLSVVSEESVSEESAPFLDRLPGCGCERGTSEQAHREIGGLLGIAQFHSLPAVADVTSQHPEDDLELLIRAEVELRCLRVDGRRAVQAGNVEGLVQALSGGSRTEP
ncbi:hypothetical protein GCM10010433_75270 [Streptomyces pulveraceus]